MDNIELPDETSYEILLCYSDNIQGEKRIRLYYPDGGMSNTISVDPKVLGEALSFCVVDLQSAARGTVGLGYRFVRIDHARALESMLGLHQE